MRLKDAGEQIFYQSEAVVLHEYDEQRLTWQCWCERLRQSANSHAIIDVILKNKNISSFKNWEKLIRYYAKYLIYSVIGNTRKKYKYDRKLRFGKAYIRAVRELQNSARLEI